MRWRRGWLNESLRTEAIDSLNADATLSAMDRSDRLDRVAELDFQRICLTHPIEDEKLYENLDRLGLVARFERLRWGLWLSVLMVGGLVGAIGAIVSLNRLARTAPTELIRSYQSGWKIAMAVALLKVLLLIPLLAYGVFEFSVLLTEHFWPNLLWVIIIGGLLALVKSGTILLRPVPLEFAEPRARAVSPEEAPELWSAIRTAAERLHTTPPDNLLIGLQFNFYVTELAVWHDGGRAAGKTLFLSLPLLKQLSPEEVVAIIGHELGHFIGEDTKLTREFYPLRLKPGPRSSRWRARGGRGGRVFNC